MRPLRSCCRCNVAWLLTPTRRQHGIHLVLVKYSGPSCRDGVLFLTSVQFLTWITEIYTWFVKIKVRASLKSGTALHPWSPESYIVRNQHFSNFYDHHGHWFLCTNKWCGVHQWSLILHVDCFVECGHKIMVCLMSFKWPCISEGVLSNWDPLFQCL